MKTISMLFGLAAAGALALLAGCSTPTSRIKAISEEISS